MILLVGRHHTLQNLQRACCIGLVNGYLLDVRRHLLVGLDILGEAVNARCAEQLQTTLRQLVLQEGRAAEQRPLLVEQLVYLLDDEHGIGQCLNLVDDILEAVFHLALVLRVAAQHGSVQLVGNGTA